MHRLSRVEDMIEEITRSQTLAMQSGATELLPTRKVKRERARKRSRSRSSESESDVDFGDLIAKRKQGKRERLRRSVSRTRRREYEEDSDWDSEELGAPEEKEGIEDLTRIFPREWLTPWRHAGERRRFLDFCKTGSIRTNENILNPFIPETEKSFFTGHMDASWNALAGTAVTSEGRKDSSEAIRVIELLQPTLESVFEAAIAIASLAAKELRRRRYSPIVLGKRERLLRRRNAQGGVGEPEEAGREHQLYFAQSGIFQGTEHPPFPPQPSALSQPGVDAQEGTVLAGMLRASLSDSSKSMVSTGSSRISRKKGGQHKSYHSIPQHQLGEWPRSQFPSPSSPEYTGRISNRYSFWIKTMGMVEARGKEVALCRETEINGMLSNSEGVTMQQGISPNRQIITRTEPMGDCENIEEVLSPFDQERRINQEISRDHEKGSWRESTETDSVYPSRTRQRNDRRSQNEKEKGDWRASGIVIEPPIGSALEESSGTAIADILEGDEITQIQHGHKTPEVNVSIIIGPPKELLPVRLVNRLSEWRKIGGDKLVSRGIKARWKSPQSPISLEERKHRQEFRGTTEMKNNYLSLLEEELKDGVVKPVPESEVKWFNPTFMVRKKNGKWRKILDCRTKNEEVQGKHFKMDSQETVVELLEENDWMTTLDISSAYQHVKVDEQFSPYLCFSIQNQCYAYEGMPFGAKDAPRAFTKTMRRAASYIKEKKKVKQGCIEIDLTGDSPVPEKSGLYTVGGEAEARTRKERGVFGMELELREDGSDAPREEESAAARGGAKMDSTCKGKKETKDEGLSSTPREVEFREVTTPTSELVDEAHAIRAEAGNSPRRLERDGDTQPNDVRRINTLEENPAREQTKESEEKEQTSRANDGRFRAGMG
ncbi:uncharacterized protein MONOS_8407 [Monocercomonoides exilis]|uniref:uncharacterized protein n=1 Tax=Monocercomonoides exilis TaxID=2049356 RepID=UPI0035597B92|nr:hypothetical protein MONOS_8407 [Monocercomonoides exilis]|eukprot:MONOS_8407.1-p1 / transcript=MONOS_8407.1 / gene=MONOS_8407 / organism=Monocercomonoides_exilis_PA203 / gene_product=unspecified product / transcript_product=unspecified product / location=Mono_scaffold00316:5040-7832(+) / protein_length=886 / sequence_SO=supercontig / SO=protein_coding / is_pseudo=false